MDTQETLAHGGELPKPVGDTTAHAAEAAPEKGSSAEAAQAPGAAQPTVDPAASAAPTDPAAGQVIPAAPLSAAGASGLAAEDADLIEKEWVHKAKEIVAQTHGDPFSQNKEINKIKAEYIKKRYNKDIKLVGE